MNIPQFTVTKTYLTGFSVGTEKELLSKLAANDLSDLYGDFIFLVEGISGNREVVIMLTSAVNANPYFYTIEDGKILHGKNIFSVFASMKMQEWNWNYDSLFCVGSLDHCIADQSLHADINRVPGGCVLIYFKGDPKETIIPVITEYDFNINHFEDAFKEYKNIANDYFTGDTNYILSLSAGMDSRLLLASLLSKGIRPVTFTMGNSEATDVKIAKRIANDFGLEHNIVSLTAGDYLDDKTAREIIKVTSGTKTFAHWHTYIYIKKLVLPGNYTHLVGANGEIARSYFFNKGILSKLLQYIDMGTFRKFFDLKFRHGDSFVLKSIKEKANEPAILDLIENCCSKPGNTADKFDWFYTFERVRNFIANGMALYNLEFSTLSPFLDERFVRLSFSLKRKYKLNSLFHKKAIGELCPGLLTYAYSENSKNIHNMDTNFYWLKRQKSISYNLPNKVLEEPFAKGLIIESLLLSPWINQAEREKLYAEKNYRALTFLFMFHYTLLEIDEIQQAKRKV